MAKGEAIKMKIVVIGGTGLIGSKLVAKLRARGHGWPGSITEQMKIIEPLTNPTAHENVRTLQGLRPGGFGILIARNMVDEMIYNDRHNEVVLIKYLDPASNSSN